MRVVGWLAVNTFNKQLRTAGKRRSFCLDVGRRSKHSSLWKNSDVSKCPNLCHCFWYVDSAGSCYAYASPVVGLVGKKGKFIPVCAIKVYGGMEV